MNTYTISQFSKRYPEVFAALPECYQADSCLLFFSVGNRLFCRPKDDQKTFLGDWRCEFTQGEWKRFDRVIQKACDDCTKGVMDQDNAHWHGVCQCQCHQ